MFPMWFVFFSVYLHSPFTAMIIFDSLLEYINGTTILKWYQSNLKQDSCLFLSIEHQKQLGFHRSPQDCLASSEFIQSGGAGVMNPEKVFMSRGKE